MWKQKKQVDRKKFEFNTKELSQKVKQRTIIWKWEIQDFFFLKLRVKVENLISDYRNYNKQNRRKQREKNWKRMQENFPKAERQMAMA